jgi:tRNA threonylcarbamoyl adenosine modification protein YeaZ
LGIETATGVCGVAIADGNGLKGEAVLDTGLSHSSKLVKLVQRVLEDTSIELSRLDALAVSVGPGSFTGVRIGIGTALGLAAGAGTPVIPVPTLDALAWAQRPFRGVVCAFVDARRGEVYYCIYETDLNGISRQGYYAVKPPGAMWADVLEVLAGKPAGTEVTLAGPRDLLEPALSGVLSEQPRVDAGATRLHVDAGSGTPQPRVDAGAIQVVVASPERAGPKPAAVAALGVKLYREGVAGGIDEVKPIYVRRSDAELRRKKKAGAS